MHATRAGIGIGAAIVTVAAWCVPVAAFQAPAEARLAALAQAPSEAGPDDLVAPVSPTGIPWDARAAEHLLNRAGFGGRGPEIAELVALGLEASIERLLSETSDREPFFIERYGPDYGAMRSMSEDDRDKIKREVQRSERQQMEDYREWWFDRLLSGEGRLHERMTLFWHGFFTSSPQGVRRTYELLKQNELVRAHALGSYADLLRGMVRDPALLMYLDNHVNKKGSPNENFARELMELFTLGEGNYTEDDVKEAARALTGRASNGEGEYVFRKGQHDRDKKTILGRTGRFDGEDLVEILLAQEACPRWVALRLLEYLEGVEPSEARLAEYAAVLREHDFALVPFLRKLFTDPAFYGEGVVGARVASPVDYLVGSARRLGIAPPAAVLHLSAAALGEKLLYPPNVKGWEGGMAWISTASLMQRGNFAGMMLGVVDVQDVVSDTDWEDDAQEDSGDGEMMGGDDETMGGESEAESETMDGADMEMEAMEETGRARRGGMPAELRAWGRVRGTWRTSLNFTARLQRAGARTDLEIVDALLDALLAVEASADSRARMLDYLARERELLGADEGRLLDGAGPTEDLLRRLAHLILSLPEAQLV